MKRILLDQGLAPRAAVLLRASGWDAVHVSELKLERATDSEILMWALDSNRTCVTLDHDFHTHLALTSASAPSVVFLRVQGLSADLQAALIERVWQTCETAVEAGAAISATTTSVRIRRLPLG